ncbi:MAG: FIST C-terminal domain-containing protein [Burkholderiales bacterium]|nr:FIST C-terminal domain-containing protein [Burkholderiales bacterium]
MTRLHAVAATAADTRSAIDTLDAQLSVTADDIRMVFAFYGCDHDDHALHSYLQRRFPRAAVIGGTSSGGFITDRGFMDERSIGLLLLDDAEGDFGVAAAPLGADPAQTAEDLLQQALTNCGCVGELPELIWVYQVPGHEEAVIAGLRRVVGDRCPIIGGSSADNDVSGQWRQLGPGGPMRAGLVVGVLFPSSPVGYAFQGGYEPAGPSGIVTGIGFQPAGDSGIVTGSVGREILTIDGAPAAAVYNRWVDSLLDARLESGGTILADSTLHPLAVDAGRIDGVTHYLLIHPESVTAAGTLRTFCGLEVGARVYAMKGDRQRLIDRAGRVVEQAGKALTDGGAQVAGGLVVYCGGCKMAVGADITRVASAVAQAIGNAPFIGCFTFGEQGHLIDRNVHGNLMISAITFGR